MTGINKALTDVVVSAITSGAIGAMVLFRVITSIFTNDWGTTAFISLAVMLIIFAIQVSTLRLRIKMLKEDYAENVKVEALKREGMAW